MDKECITMDYAKYLRMANEVAKEAVANGNNPFGAVLVDENGEVIMSQGNAEKDLGDATAHAERYLTSRTSQVFSKEKLWKCTLVTTCEPCCMCMGAIYWANIGHVVYGVSEKQLLELTGSDEKNPTFDLDCRTVVAAGQKDIEIVGPIDDPKLIEEIVELHRGFWNN